MDEHEGADASAGAEGLGEDGGDSGADSDSSMPQPGLVRFLGLCPAFADPPVFVAQQHGCRMHAQLLLLPGSWQRPRVELRPVLGSKDCVECAKGASAFRHFCVKERRRAVSCAPKTPPELAAEPGGSMRAECASA